MGAKHLKNIIVDTNVLIDEFEEVFHIEDATIIIPAIVFEELDNLKTRDGSIGQKARKTIGELDALLEKGDILKGIQLQNSNSELKVVWDDRGHEERNDFKVLDVVDIVSQYYPDTYLYTKDVSLKLIAKSWGVKLYKPTPKRSRSGVVHELYVDGETIDELYNAKGIPNTFDDFYPNEYVTLKSISGTSQSALARYNINTDELVLVKSPKAFGIKPKNLEQTCALDALLNPNIPVVVLTGVSGTGKTYLSLAVALEQVIERQKFSRIMLSKPNIPIGSDLGFLPGTKEEKLFNWFGNYRDNIQQLIGEEDRLNYFVSSGLIELEALAYLRGRSLHDCFILIDEVQNISIEQIKTILTRVGDKSKIVLMGDVTQIDNRFLTQDTNGLTYLINKIGNTDLIVHIHLTDSGLRSKLTTWAVENL